MKYTMDERIDIGRQVVTQELSRQEAMLKYGIGQTCMSKYIRLYKRSAGIPTSVHLDHQKHSGIAERASNKAVIPNIEDYMSMSKEELINELIRAKANELRAKKGYEVKGVGANKEFIPLNRPSLKS